MVAALRALLLRHAPTDGKHATALPGLWLQRASAPRPMAPAEARMVTFAVVVQGQKRVGFAGRTLMYGPGSYLFITGEQRYSAMIEEARADRPYLSLAIELSPELVTETVLALADAGAAPGGAEEPAHVGALDAAMADAVMRVVRTLDDEVEQRLVAPLALRELVVRLLRGEAGASLSAAARDDGRILRAMAFMREHAARRLTVEQVARAVAMSSSHFAHRFREVARVSPMRYVKHVRLERARLLMLGAQASAAEAAATVGYASPSHFTRDFKAHFGASPGAYSARFRAGAS